MATRTLLCVEPDETAVAVIRAALEPYGFEVKNIPNGEQAVEWARQNAPQLAVVCVEPRKVGYAICNKLKRSPDLQMIPVILTSSEETQQTFDQHKKLKSRADEYILKPLRQDEILTKVGQFVPLGEPQDQDQDARHEDVLFDGVADESEEISIAEGDIVEEEEHTASVPIPLGFEPPKAAAKAESPFGGGDLDSIFDQETDAAFAAIQTGGGAKNPIAAPAPAGMFDPATDHTPSPPVAGGDETPPPALTRAAATALGDWDVEQTRQAAANDFAAALAGDGLFSQTETPPLPDDVSAPMTLDVAPRVDDRKLRELEQKVLLLEEDKRRLLADADELKTRLQSQPLSKEKEVLNLREIINRKEKDLLDLRDAVDAKDRQILDHKDRIRENERARRDLEETMLGMEKTLMAANERVAALAQDKDKSNEREKNLKARLDDALTEIQKAHDEVDTFKKRLQATEERGRADVERVRTELEGRLREAVELHREEIARLSDEKVAAEESLERQYEAKIAQIQAGHAAEMEALNKKVAEELAAQQERLVSETSRLRRDSEKALASAKEEQAVQLAAERQAHQAAIETKERDHKNEILGLRRRHEEELRGAEERRQRELTEAEARRIEDLEAAEARRRQELQSRDEEHHAKIAEMDRAHFEEKTTLSERHRGELDQAHARAARSEGELAARTEELSETHRRLAGLSADVDATRADLRDREVKLSQARDRITELESKVAEYEEQILRAFQKLRSDDKVIDRAKRALAVALTLLDERAGAPANVPAAPTQPSRAEESAT